MTSRVLVVDDDLHMAKAITTMLAGRAYEVRTATDAASVLSNALGWHPAIVIVDLEMPSVDGLDMCRRVRATWPRPIVVAFGANNRQSEVEAHGAGADDYIGGPFKADELSAFVRTVLRRRTGARGVSQACKRTKG